MTTSRTEGTSKRRRRAKVWRRVHFIGGPSLLILVFCVAWVGTRAYLAKGELDAAAPLVSQIQQQLLKDDGAAAKKTADQLAGHSTSAASLTGDPIWKAAEVVPWLGPNLSVFAVVSATVNDVAVNVIQPLAGVANGISLSDFKPNAGAIALQPFIDAQPTIAAASAALESSNARVAAVDTSQTLAPVRDATAKFAGMLEKASVELASLNRAAQLIPRMLGGDGPRNYLLLFQNPAELVESCIVV